VCLCALGVLIGGARADVRYRAIFPGQGLPGIDFDGDGVFELTFSSYALTTASIESSGALILTVICSEQTEVLVDTTGYVRPLRGSVLLSPSPDAGVWSRAAYGSTVWTFPFASTHASGTNILAVGDSPIALFPFPSLPPSSTNIIVISGGPVGEDLLEPMPRGVGMPGYGSFMGFRFQRAEAWHYGWVHFGVREATPAMLPALDLPSVLGFAYESVPDALLEVGTRPLVVPITDVELEGSTYLRVRWSARIGQDYHVETRRHLDWHAWTPVSFRIPGVADAMMIDLPITEGTQFFRVIEAD
jgi:hypothetical protein